MVSKSLNEINSLGISNYLKNKQTLFFINKTIKNRGLLFIFQYWLGYRQENTNCRLLFYLTFCRIKQSWYLPFYCVIQEIARDSGGIMKQTGSDTWKIKRWKKEKVATDFQYLKTLVHDEDEYIYFFKQLCTVSLQAQAHIVYCLRDFIFH